MADYLGAAVAAMLITSTMTAYAIAARISVVSRVADRALARKIDHAAGALGPCGAQHERGCIPSRAVPRALEIGLGTATLDPTHKARSRPWISPH